MIEGLQILSSETDDMAAQQVRAMQSPTLGNIIAHRLAQFAKGHGEAADDAVGYAAMLAPARQHFLQPMLDRTHGQASTAELRAAARAAEKLAALCWAFADKARRHAGAIEAAEQQQES